MPKRGPSRTKSPKNYARNHAAYLSARNPKERRSKRTGRLGLRRAQHGRYRQQRKCQSNKCAVPRSGSFQTTVGIWRSPLLESRGAYNCMFPQLSDKVQEIFKDLRGYGVISESNVDAALRQVRLALLEADVDFQVARKFIGRVKEKALGETVVRSITPRQQIVKIFHDELTALLGGDSVSLHLEDQVRILVVGLNGSGKTTSSAKLARFLQKQDYSPVLVPCDLQRPAAIEQLGTLGKQIGAAVVAPDLGEKNVQRAAAAALAKANPSGPRTI